MSLAAFISELDALVAEATAKFAAAGAKVVSITAKDKLRKQLAKGLDVSQGHVSFSTEFAERATMAENGIENVLEFVGMPKPGMYSMELSLFVLEAGLKLLQQRRPDLLFLSLTDWVQHKWAPAEAALNFPIVMPASFLAASVSLHPDTSVPVWLSSMRTGHPGTHAHTAVMPTSTQPSGCPKATLAGHLPDCGGRSNSRRRNHDSRQTAPSGSDTDSPDWNRVADWRSTHPMSFDQ